MRTFLIAIGLGLAPGGVALADAADNCVQNNDRDRQIRACTLIIEGRVKGHEFAAAKAVPYYNRGNAYNSKGEHDRAIADYGQAIRLDPKNRTPITTAASPITAKAIMTAPSRITISYQLRPANTGSYMNRGIAHYSKGDYDRAIADYGQAIRLNPKDANSLCDPRHRLSQQGRYYDRAIAEFGQSIRLDPKDPKAYENRGYAYDSKGDFDRAIADTASPSASTRNR